jgi:Ca-activated chloride channel family protein
MPNEPQDYYKTLGIHRSASQDEIRHAYIKAAKRLHPDANVSPGETQMFMDVHAAYQVLSNPQKKTAYDASLPPEKVTPDVIKHRIMVSRKSLTHMNEDQLVYVLLELSPNDEVLAEPKSVPLNICLMLDVSTSMKGEKLEMVKAAAIEIIHKLKPQDIFSVVAFNDKAEVVIPATRQANLLKMENIIKLLQPSGGTEIFKGLQAGLQEINRYNNLKSINHLILLTDGHTYGDEQSCYDLARDAAIHGTGISGLGIGNDWNDVFLDELANLTAGHSMLVSVPQDIGRLLDEKFTNLTNVFAENVVFNYELDENSEISYIFRIQPETDPLTCQNPLRLGPILQIWPLTVLIELVIHPRKTPESKLIILTGNLDISASSLDFPIPEIPVNIQLEIKTSGDPDLPPQAIIQALSKLTLYRMQDKVRSEVASGNYEKATQHLQRLATHLFAQGEKSLAKTIIFEIQNIETEKTYSEQGKKQIKYGTKALSLYPGENTP